MANLQKQIDALTAYFQADCARPGVLPIALTIEHFITRLDGTPVDYAQLAQVIYSMQGHDEPLREDNVYLGFRCPSYTITIQAGCQVTISLAPYPTVLQAMAVYEGCFTRLCNALAANNMYARTVGVHPSRRAELLPLVPQSGYMIMDRYFRNTGNQGGVMLRATASTRVTIRYTSEADFVRKFRVACLITPLLALLTDNVPLYQGESNHNYSIHTHIWNNVDPDRCGIYPNVMDSNFGFESYAAYILQQPLVVARHGERIVGVGRKSAFEVYPSFLGHGDIEQILSMFYYDVCLNHNGIELRTADSLAPRYAASYAQLIKTLFSSHAAQEGILRRYAGANSAQIEAAKVGICCNGYQAQVYGRAAAGEVSWLLAQAKSHAAGRPRPSGAVGRVGRKKAHPARDFRLRLSRTFPSVPPCIKPSFLRYTNAKQQKRGVSHAGNIVPCSNYRNDRACPLGNAECSGLHPGCSVGHPVWRGARLAAYLPYVA